MDDALVIPTVDGPMDTYLAEPAGEPRGAIVVVQEAYGVTSHIRTVCDRLAAVGWTAVAPALFHRVGSPVFAYDDLNAVMPLLRRLSSEHLTVDIDATLGHLVDAGFPAARTGIVGFCMGGSVALATAATRTIGAAVTFYGGGLTRRRFGYPPLVDLAPEIRTPWLGLFGDLDRGIPIEEVETLRDALDEATVTVEVVRYPEAGHGFNCDDRPSSFHPPSAADAWTLTLAWFERFLGPPPTGGPLDPMPSSAPSP